MIPKKIHYCWFGRGELPELAHRCIDSWKKYMPGYEIIEWNEDNFDIHCNKYVEEAYNNKKYAFVSDYARLKILYDNGGIYFDVDVELIKPIDEKFLINGYFALENKKYINTGLGFASSKENEILKLLLKDYESSSFINNGKMDTTPCPVRNTNTLIHNGYKIKEKSINGIIILKPKYCNPLNYETGIIKITSDTFSIHHYVASWLDEDSKKNHDLKVSCINKYGVFGKIVYYFVRIKEIIKSNI